MCCRVKSAVTDGSMPDPAASRIEIGWCAIVKLFHHVPNLGRQMRSWQNQRRQGRLAELQRVPDIESDGAVDVLRDIDPSVLRAGDCNAHGLRQIDVRNLDREGADAEVTRPL